MMPWSPPVRCLFGWHKMTGTTEDNRKYCVLCGDIEGGGQVKLEYIDGEWRYTPKILRR